MRIENIEILGIFWITNIWNNTFVERVFTANNFTLCISMIRVYVCVYRKKWKKRESVDEEDVHQAPFKWLSIEMDSSQFSNVLLSWHSHGIEIENSTFSINSMRSLSLFTVNIFI